jgi:type I restriction enzyme R subunit
MATGTGKTVISTAIIRFFLRSTNVKRVLFLVDRLELEGQADREFKQILKNDFSISVWKENKSDWNRSQIVVSTIQSLISQNRYKRIFDPSDFDLIISDEAHRSLGGKSRKVFEYFNGYKLGLTATPKDYLKSVDIKKLGLKNPKALEKRKLLDTYTTFGCQSGEPTFRYSLVDGVSDGYLVNPKTFDIRTNISTQLLSDDGYYFSGYDDDGNPVEDDISAKKFEKKYFNEKTNISFCKSFLENAKKDPFSGEIGKSIIFCISQKHASKITQILNEFADQMYPGQYQSDFALQITSNITNPNPQKMTKQFRNNSLNGNSNYNNAYKTSKTRICVTVGMMTTGYDCRDILNIGLMRPIFSPADFIQMKGRGTRIFDFKDMWKDKEVMPNLANTKKDCFHLIDFFGNYKYFEEEYEYDTSLDLPKITKPSTEKDPSLTPSFSGKITDLALDDIDTIAEYQHEDGMKIDRMFFNEFSKTIKEDHSELKEMILNHNFDDAADYLIKNILNKPERYFTMENLQEALQLDRNLTPKELLQYIFDLIPNIPSKKECLEEDFEKFDDLFQPDKEDFDNIKHIFKAYIDNKTVKSIIDNKEYAKFNHHPSGRYFKNLSKKYKEEIPSYINKFVDLNKYAN